MAEHEGTTRVEGRCWLALALLWGLRRFPAMRKEGGRKEARKQEGRWGIKEGRMDSWLFLAANQPAAALLSLN